MLNDLAAACKQLRPITGFGTNWIIIIIIIFIILRF